jgi:hypothetical protein
MVLALPYLAAFMFIPPDWSLAHVLLFLLCFLKSFTGSFLLSFGACPGAAGSIAFLLIELRRFPAFVLNLSGERSVSD